MTEESAETSPQNSHPTGAVGEKFELLMDLLRELFQLDKGDLDFGLYRVMNMKSAEIEAFLTNELLPQAKSGLSRLKAEAVESIESELAKLINDLKQVGMVQEAIDNVPKVVELRARRNSPPKMPPPKGTYTTTCTNSSAGTTTRATSCRCGASGLTETPVTSFPTTAKK